MYKIMIAAAAASALAFLISRRAKRTTTPLHEPARSHPGNGDKHLTNVFSKAKKYGSQPM